MRGARYVYKGHGRTLAQNTGFRRVCYDESNVRSILRLKRFLDDGLLNPSLSTPKMILVLLQVCCPRGGSECGATRFNSISSENVKSLF